MAQDVFANWVLRGRAHQQEGRPADALPCFRRAAREDPRSPLPHYHLGEALWQLGLVDDAQRAWHAAADRDRTFVPPRLALAEAALARGDYAAARALAGDAVAAAPDDARARLTLAASGAALGDHDALADTAARVAADAAPAAAPALASALAAALRAGGAGHDALVAALAPHVAALPLPLLVSGS